MFRNALIVAVLLGISGAPAFAAEPEPAAPADSSIQASVGAAVGQVDWLLPPIEPARAAARRPAVLPVLYVSLVTLEAYDGYSTLQGTSRSAHEANPLMQGVAQQPVALWAVKAASTALPMLVAERMWRNHHRAGAIVVMAATNGVIAAVVANNARVLAVER